jgi:hypothetical protein
MDDENLKMFMSITGCTDVQVAKNYFEFGGNDFENAVTLYMESENDKSGFHDIEPGKDVIDLDQEDPILHSPRTRSVISDEPVVIESNQRNVRNTASPTFEMPFDHRFSDFEGSAMFNRGVGHRQSRLEEAERVWENNDRLANLFQPPYDIMFTGSLDMACKEAVKTTKWLMVTIHNPTEFPCQVLNRDLWKDAGLIY